MERRPIRPAVRAPSRRQTVDRQYHKILFVDVRHLKIAFNVSMADPSFPARYSTALAMLNTTTTNLFQQYTAAQTAGSSLTGQNTQLQAQVESLNAKLANIKKTGETYDREFIDRSAGKGSVGFARLRGISTLQDWLLLIFFVSYAIICICILFYTVAASQEKLFAGVMVLTTSVIFGVMMSAVIMRFI